MTGTLKRTLRNLTGKAVVVVCSRVAGELGKVAEGVGGSQLTWELGRVGEGGEGEDLVLVILKLLDLVL